MSRLFKTLLTSAALIAAFGPLAAAAGRNPGSLLIYPSYNSTPGSGTVISITNTKDDPSFNPNTNLNGVADIHFIYIDGEYWQEFNRFERLTPNDTFTVLADYHNPNSEIGFLYCVALNPVTQQPMSHNWLIGDEIVADAGGNWMYGFEAIAFKAIPGEGEITDLDADGMLDLDGNEYERVADQMMISSFIGQNVVTSSLILLSLVGSGDYRTTIDFRVFNNNEHEFSATYDFYCWTFVNLADIDNVFTNSFLASTWVDTTPNGLSAGTTGWASIDGDRAVDTVGNEPKVNDPPFVGALAQSLGGFSVGHLLHESDALNATNGVLDSLQ